MGLQSYRQLGPLQFGQASGLASAAILNTYTPMVWAPNLNNTDGLEGDYVIVTADDWCSFAWWRSGAPPGFGGGFSIPPNESVFLHRQLVELGAVVALINATVAGTVNIKMTVLNNRGIRKRGRLWRCTGPYQLGVTNDATVAIATATSADITIPVHPQDGRPYDVVLVNATDLIGIMPYDSGGATPADADLFRLPAGDAWEIATTKRDTLRVRNLGPGNTNISVIGLENY